jgi:hypothetical protein
MMTMINNIQANITNDEHKNTLISHAKALNNAALECLPVDEDRKELHNQYEKYFISKQ